MSFEGLSTLLFSSLETQGKKTLSDIRVPFVFFFIEALVSLLGSTPSNRTLYIRCRASGIILIKACYLNSFLLLAIVYFLLQAGSDKFEIGCIDTKFWYIRVENVVLLTESETHQKIGDSL